MLRLVLARSARRAHGFEQGIVRSTNRQWQPQPAQFAVAWRGLADKKTVDDKTVAGVPQEPIIDAAKSEAAQEVRATSIPSTPPTPAEVGSATPPPTTASTLPTTGTGTASTGPSTSPITPVKPAPKRRSRFRTFLTSLVILSVLGYAGGVYYSLVSDNFHDFFTEYVPFGEDAVGYFEEREFRKRFPQKAVDPKTWPQTRGEQKVTIGRNSGLSARAAQDDKTQDLATKGRHVSAVEDNTKKTEPAPAQSKAAGEAKEASKAAPKPAPAKDSPPKTPPPTPAAPPATSAAPPAPAASSAQAGKLVDHVNVSQATEPVVQNLVKMVNDIITTINASPEASKFSSTVSSAKSELQKVISGITELKEKTRQDAEKQMQNMHTEFDTAAKELVNRLQREMQEQESKWREEYENERERLSNSYNQRVTTELDAAKKVAAEKEKSAILEKEIELQQRFKDEVQKHVEEERDGRLSKLDQLSTSVADLQKLTGEWNSVIDANLKTQHLHVALEAVRAAIHNQDAPQPFLNELVALKEIGKDNELISSAIASIHPASYQRGVPSPSALIDRFRRVASEVRKASLLPEDAGVASHAASAVLSRLMFDKRDRSGRGLPEGEDVEAVLGRAEVLLEEGRLDEAAREMNGLKGWAGVLSRDWVEQCRRVLEVQQAVDVISTEARLQSLLVE